MFVKSSILSTILFALILTDVRSAQTSSRLNLYQINAKKPIHVVSDKFLSFTIDPTTLMHAADCQLTNLTINLVRTLLPAYLRVAGPDSNKLLFKSKHDSKSSSDTSILSNQRAKHHLLLTAYQWSKFNEFVSKTGLNLIVCLNGALFDENTDDRDLSNGLEFITYSNKNNLTMDWQLGYELQQISNDDGRMTGHDVTKLRKILEIFPRYQHSLILGPDVTSMETREDLLFLRNYLIEAKNSLNVFTIHPNFSTRDQPSDNYDGDVYTMLAEQMSKMDNYLWSKDGPLKATSKGVVPRKPVWIAESETKKSLCNFSDAMVFVERLGAAAKVGVSVYLRKPHLMSLYEPTPEYWVSALYKSLVGRTVLDSKLSTGNATTVRLFSHCTLIGDKQPQETVLNPSVRYERGAITVYGVNTGSESVRLGFKIGIRPDETLHLYVLTEESKSPTTSNILLNKQRLCLSADNEIPLLSPKVRQPGKYAFIPPRSVFFVVLPDANSRVCATTTADQLQDKAKIKQPSYVDVDDDDMAYSNDATPGGGTNVEYAEDEDDRDARYVTYPKQMSEPVLQAAPSIGVKYITFSDDTWMSELPEKLREAIDEERRYSEDADKARNSPSKLDKYRLIADSVLGKRNSSENALINVRQRRSIDLEMADALYRNLEKIDDTEPYVYHYPHPESHPSSFGDQFSHAERERRHISQPLPLNATSEATNEKREPTIVDPIDETELLFDEDSIVERANRDVHPHHKSSKNTFHDLSELEQSMRQTSSSIGPVSPFSKRAAKKTRIAKSKKPEPSLSSSLIRANDTVESNGTISTGETPSSLSGNEPTVEYINKTRFTASKPAEDHVSEITVATSSTPIVEASSQFVPNSSLVGANASSSVAASSPASSTESATVVESISALPTSRSFNGGRVSSVRRRVLSGADVSLVRSRHPAEGAINAKPARVSLAPSSFADQSTPPRLAPSQLADFYNGKLKELLNQHLAKIEEIRRRARERAAARRRNAASQRSKREISVDMGDAESGSNDQPNDEGANTDDVVGIARPRLHPSTASPANDKPVRRLAKVTTAAPVIDPPPKRPKPSKLHCNNQNRTATPRPRDKFEPHRAHRRDERDIFGDTFAKAKEIYADLSSGVKEQMKPVSHWVSDRVDDIKHEFTRTMKREARADEYAGQSPKNRIDVRDVGVNHRPKLADRLKHREEERQRDGNRFTFRFSLLKNRTGDRGHSKSIEKPTKIYRSDHQHQYNRAARSIENNEILDELESNEIFDHPATNFDVYRNVKLADDLLTSTRAQNLVADDDEIILVDDDMKEVQTAPAAADEQYECKNDNIFEYGWCKIKVFFKLCYRLLAGDVE